MRALTIAAIAVMALVGCNTVEGARKDARNLGQRTGDVVEKVGEKVGDAARATGDAVESGARKVKRKISN